jgi:hypothetical protein
MDVHLDARTQERLTVAVARLFERLGVASRTELATRALREGWLDVPRGSV